jgi:AraC family transcriptional regulator
MTQNNSTFLEYVARINKVIDFILNNLGEVLNVKELSKIASFSEFHFQRVFKMITGEALSGYIKRKRLERAASTLVSNHKRPITDIAYSFGFSSVANFSKAFKAYFGISPSEHRCLLQHDGEKLTISKNGKQISRNGKQISTYGKDFVGDFWNSDNSLDLEALLKTIDIEIRELQPKHVAYVRVLKGYKHDLINRAWDKLINWAKPRGLLSDDSVGIGITYDDPDVTGEDNCQYDACIEVPDHILDFQGEIGIQDIPGGSYVVHSFLADMRSNSSIANAFFNAYCWIMFNSFILEDNAPFMTFDDNPDESGNEKVGAKIFIRIQSAI